MHEKKKRDPLIPVIIITVLLGILAAGCFYANMRVRAMKAEQLQALQDEVDVKNQRAEDAYQAALAEFEAQTSSGANLAWPQQKMTGWDVVDLTNYPLENTATMTLSRQDTMYNGMLLVNEWHSRPNDFLEDIPRRYIPALSNTVYLPVNMLRSTLVDIYFILIK